MTVSTLLGKTGTLVPSEGINRIKSATIDKKKKVKKDTRTLLKVKKVAQVKEEGEKTLQLFKKGKKIN